MKNCFLKKYQDYCRSRDAKNDIFKMQQMEDETLEDYLERFRYNYQNSKQRLNDNTMKTIFLKGIQDEYIDILNIMGSGDISLLPFDDIGILCRKYSRSKAKHGKSVRDTRVNKSALGGVTRVELGNMLENFKTDIVGTLSSQLDTIKVKKRHDEEKLVLSIFCSKCQKRHPLKECPLNTMSICGICMKDHITEECPSFPGLQAIFKQGSDPAPPPLQTTQRRPWQQRPQAP